MGLFMGKTIPEGVPIPDSKGRTGAVYFIQENRVFILGDRYDARTHGSWRIEDETLRAGVDNMISLHPGCKRCSITQEELDRYISENTSKI